MKTRQLLSRRRFLSSATATLAASGTVHASDRRAYERKYKTLENPRVDVGAVYIPFLGSKWGKCIDHRPAPGQYDISDSSVVNRHVDQMQGHGISTLMFNFGAGPKDLDRYRTFREADLASDIDLEAFYVINRVFQRDLDIDRYLDFMREEMFAHPNYNTVDGRPVVQFWGSNYIPWHDETAERVEEEWGGFAEFVSYIRERLTRGGTEPYLVSDINDVPPNGLPPRQGRWNRQFDGVSTWFSHFKDGRTPWDWFLEQTEEEFRLLREFADRNEIDFLPMAFPGFDDRTNDCWGEQRHLPRNVDRFADVLALADRYRTRDRINLATFNGWPEGHQVEPGRFDGADYGTTYLEAIETFQKDPPATTTESGTTTDREALTATETTSEPPSTATEPITTSSHSVTAEESRTSVPGFGPVAGLAGAGLGTYRYLNSKE